jgi:hypothetical protein
MTARTLFVGIDVAMAKGKRLPVAFMLADGGPPQPLPVRIRDVTGSLSPPRGMGNAALVNDPSSADAFATAVADYVDDVSRALAARVAGIAVDAPANFGPEGGGLRRSEAALGVVGLSYFRTPSRSAFDHHLEVARSHLAAGGAVSRLPYANLFWMLVGFALFRRLPSRFADIPILEVYPQATFWALGAAGEHKSSKPGFEAQRRALADRVGVDPGQLERELRSHGYGKPHDVVDALSAAWVASLPLKRRRVLGADVQDGIWVPA